MPFIEVIHVKKGSCYKEQGSVLANQWLGDSLRLKFQNFVPSVSHNCIISYNFNLHYPKTSYIQVLVPV